MRRILSIVLMLSMMITMIPSIAPATEVFAVDAVSDSSVFLKQDKNNTCTLSSAAMMLRRRAYLEGNVNWSSITESAIRSTAWSANGMYWSFKYAGISVDSSTFSGTASEKRTKLLSLLSAHPEGVVIYMYGSGLKTHAVLATDYDSSTDTVYCADPANNIAKGRIPLTSAYLTGTTQNERIGNLRMYWYVSSGNCNLTIPEPEPEPEVHNHSYSSSYESSHPHYCYQICSSCDNKMYMGTKELLSNCKQCYPVGNLSLRRSVEKSKGNATFYRNNVENANNYTLRVRYTNGNNYGEYDMNQDSYTVKGMPSGEYYAVLYAKNTSTGEERSTSCATFKIIEKYDVKFNANGGINPPSNQIKYEDIPLTLTTHIPTKEGHIFKGWAKSKNALTAEYSAGGTYDRNAKVTLYAVWEPEVYDVTFDANGGTGTADSVKVTYGNKIKMPNSVIKEYSYLKGWSQNKNATTPEYTLGTEWKIKQSMTLYAIWGDATWGGEVSDSLTGSGTEADPYIISSEADLAYLANKVNTQTSAPEYEYYKLTENINLTYNEWVPIGVYSNTNQYFYGSFDGNGYTISDLYITKANSGYVGLFGYTKDSQIKNLTAAGMIENVSSTSKAYIGGVAGYCKNTELNKLTSKYFSVSGIAVDESDTSSYSPVGTVVGMADGGNITDCGSYDSNIGLKSGRKHAGLIAGYSTANISSCTVISTSGGLFNANASVEAYSIGGVCGVQYGTAEKCSVYAPYFSNNAMTTSTTRIGGLFGELYGSAKVCSVQFNDLTANSITSTGQGTISVGGLAGYMGDTAKITDCKFDGKSISGTTTSGEANIGGVAGSAVAKQNIAMSITGNQVISRDKLPQKEGYTATWYTDKNHTAKYDFEQKVRSSLKLYALWEEGKAFSDIWDGTSKEPAYDANTKTYTITSGEELAWISDVSNGIITVGDNMPTDVTFDGYTVVLTKSIYLNDKNKTNKWKPINRNVSYPFSGVFDGQNYTIYGLYISDEQAYSGLFGCLNGTVKKIFIEDGQIDGTSHVGGIVGYGDKDSEIKYCSVNAQISGDEFGGGIVGTLYGTVDNCINLGKIGVTDQHGGGIAGHVNGASVTFSTNYGEVYYTRYYGGGIVGYSQALSLIEFCNNEGSVYMAFGDGAGGILGGGICSILNCFNSGSVESDEGAGGIGGWCQNVNVSNCYNLGKIKTLGLRMKTVGGIIGAASSLCSATKCYNIGEARYCTSSSSFAEGGGIVGCVTDEYNGEFEISYCYSNTSQLYMPADSYLIRIDSYSISMTSDKMKLIANLVGFNEEGPVWSSDVGINEGFPYLNALKETYKTYTVMPYIDKEVDEDTSSLNRVVINVDGKIIGNSNLNSYLGSIIGFGKGESNSFTEVKNIVSMVDSISSTTTGSSYKAYAGNIIGYNTDSKFLFDNTYYNSEMTISSSTSDINSAEGTSKAEKSMNVGFYTSLLGLTPYTSLANLTSDDKAVWVLKNGELPELYYNCLNDITISDEIENGKITLNKTQAVDGEKVTITATPDEGYVLNTIYVNGEEKDGTEFTVSGDSEVYVTFTEKVAEYKVSIETDANVSGTLVNVDAQASTPELMSLDFMSASDNGESMTANDGEEIQVNAVADADYTVDAIYVNGEEIAGDSFIISADTVVTMDVTSISTDYTATTDDATDVSDYFAVLSGTVSGDTEGVRRYIRYWSANDSDTVYTTTVEEGSGDYSTEVFGLMPETTYYYQMTEFGEVKSFTTCVAPEEEYAGDDSEVTTAPITSTTYSVSGTNYKFDIQSEQVLNGELLCVAAYTSEGKLVQLTTVPTNGLSAYTAYITKQTNITYAKVFVWNTGSLAPVAGVETVSIAQ